jgi:hypothetical protein
MPEKWFIHLRKRSETDIFEISLENRAAVVTPPQVNTNAEISSLMVARCPCSSKPS